MRKAFCLLLILLVVPASALAQEFPNYQEKYVNDFAGIFSTEQATELRYLFAGIDTVTTAEMTVLTVETVSPYAMSDYAQEIFDKWKIGKTDKDNGLLILYAKDTQKIWVQTGYGLEGILPDSKVGRILDETFVPARTAGNATDGIVQAAHAYADVITANKEEVKSGQAGSPFDWSVLFPIAFMILVVVVPFFLAYASAHPKCECGGRADAIKTETKTEKKKGAFGFDTTVCYTIITYKCKKCGKTWTKRKEGHYMRNGMFLVAMSGSGHGGGFGGGFGGGGFGGGGSGGGGAGR